MPILYRYCIMGKNVLLINNGYPSELYPEYTTYISSIEECITASGRSVSKLVIRFERPITPFYKLYKYFLFWLKCATIRTDCDILYINHLPYAFPLILNPFIKHKKVVVHWHGNELTGNGKFVQMVNSILARFVRKAQNIVPSLYFSRKLQTRFGKYGLRIAVSPSGGVDTPKFSPSAIVRQNFAIGYSSELRKDKGADIFLYLIKKCSEIERLTGRTIEFHYIKYGSELSTYLPLLNKFDTKTVKGYAKMPKADMPAFLNSTDLLVFPSQRQGESLGLAALEAMSCGVPVVAHNICAFPEYIKPGVSGELVEIKDSESDQNRAFMAAVVKAIKNIGKYSPRSVVEAHYSQASVISFYRNLFDTL